METGLLKLQLLGVLGKSLLPLLKLLDPSLGLLEFLTELLDVVFQLELFSLEGLAEFAISFVPSIGEHAECDLAPLHIALLN